MTGESWPRRRKAKAARRAAESTCGAGEPGPFPFKAEVSEKDDLHVQRRNNCARYEP